MKAILLSLCLLPALAWAVDSSPDAKFYGALAEGGNGEVELGQLASERGNDPGVRDFGALMVKDHSAANEQLQTLAATKNLKLPDGSGLRGHAKKLELEALRGDAFDKAYISSQIKAHEATVALLQKESAAGADADARAFAGKVLPTVRSHLSMARKLGDSLGVSTK
jgi:putative membrane protein